MAQYRLGNAQEARDTLATALNMADWDLSRVRSHDQWIWHILRREAEGTIPSEPQAAAAHDQSVTLKAP
jgi:serine/threonine-protein kinase